MALRSNTKAAYNNSHSIFLKFCESYGVDPYSPISEVDLCRVAVSYAISHKITSLPSYISAISNWSESLSLGPLARGSLYKAVIRGLNNYYGDTAAPNQKRALTLADLALLRRDCDNDLDRFAGARDWCMYVFAFFGLLRIREFCSAALMVRDVDLAMDFVTLTIQFSKTSLLPTPIMICARADILDPVTACASYKSLLPRQMLIPSLPFFRAQPDLSPPPSPAQFVVSLRARLGRCRPDVEPTDWAGHSFRRGGASALQLAGVPEALIQAHGRWRSIAYRRYFEGTAVQRLIPTRTIPLLAEEQVDTTRVSR
jgi:hypothetical protein